MNARTTTGALVTVALALASCTGPRSPATSPTTRTAAPATTSPPAAPKSSTTTSSTTATTAAGPGARGLAATDRLERQHPLAAALPHETAHYRIDFSVGANGRLQVRVTLLAILNNFRDLPGYQAQLHQYKAEAVAFIQAREQDPATYTVAWLPAEAAAL